jgi:hypothetical protein
MALSHSPQIVRDGLILYLDPANIKSYPGTGSIVYNLNNSLETSTLINGPTFTTFNKGEVILDGINDFIRIDNSVTSQNLSPSTATFDIWIKPDNTGYGTGNRSSPISRGNYNTSGGFFIHLRYTSSPSIEASFSNSTTNSYSFQGPTTTVAPAWNEWIN